MNTFEIRVTTTGGETANFHVRAEDAADAMRKALRDVRSEFTGTPVDTHEGDVVAKVSNMGKLETDATLVT